MSKQSLIFVVGSILVHLTLVTSVLQPWGFESGLAKRGKNIAKPRNSLNVRLISEKDLTNTLIYPRPSLLTFSPKALNYPNTADSSAGFLPSGKLTRLPTPIGNIDLSGTPPSNLARSTTVKLTLWIDAEGNVKKATFTPHTNHTETAFAEEVVKRFKNAKFKPGEVEGSPVQSQVTITVVSEAIE